MTGRKRDLSRLTGLLSVAAEAGQPTGNAPTTLPVSALTPSAVQPRREFDQVKIDQLTESIRERGVLQPLLVRPVGQQYEIVAGERRWRAAKSAGLREVPVLVRELDDTEARHLALIENLQREDLNAVDEVDAKLALAALSLGLTPAKARARLMQMLREAPGEEHAQMEALFKGFGETWPSFVKNKLRILNWPEHLLTAVRSGLPFTLAAVIVTAPAEHQQRLIQKARQGASRQDLRAMVKALVKQEKTPQTPQFKAVARILGSTRWLETLSPQDRADLDQWLSTMPPALKNQLKA